MDADELSLGNPFRDIGTYDVIVEGRIVASIYPVSKEYLIYLRNEEGVVGCINLTGKPWPNDWASATGLEYSHIPVTDMKPLTNEQAMDGIEFMDRLVEKGAVMVHCAAGVGRTGSLISMYLIYHGMDPRSAVALVRERRPGSVETRAQYEKVLGFKLREGERK